jgi:hypothetical protein
MASCIMMACLTTSVTDVADVASFNDSSLSTVRSGRESVMRLWFMCGPSLERTRIVREGLISSNTGCCDRSIPSVLPASVLRLGCHFLVGCRVSSVAQCMYFACFTHTVNTKNTHNVNVRFLHCLHTPSGMKLMSVSRLGRVENRRFTLGSDSKSVLSPRPPPTAHAFLWASKQRGNPILRPI